MIFRFIGRRIEATMPHMYPSGLRRRRGLDCRHIAVAAAALSARQFPQVAHARRRHGARGAADEHTTLDPAGPGPPACHQLTSYNNRVAASATRARTVSVRILKLKHRFFRRSDRASSHKGGDISDLDQLVTEVSLWPPAGTGPEKGPA